MASLRLPPGQMRRRPAKSKIDRAIERVYGSMVQRVTPYHKLQWLECLGVSNEGMVPATTDCAEGIRREANAARAQISRQHHAAWRRRCARRSPARQPRARARRHRVARRAAAKATADRRRS